MYTLLGTLALYGLIVMITILAQVLAAARQLTPAQLASNRDDLPPLTGPAFRMDRAQMNSVVALALFAPVVLILHLTGEEEGFALFLAQLFVLARVAYVVLYALGIPWLRTAAWLLGFGATFWLYLLAL